MVEQAHLLGVAVHPSQLTPEARRNANASVFDRLARAHEKLANQGVQPSHQRLCAESAHNAAERIRKDTE